MVASDQISLAALLAEARRRAPRGATALTDAELREPLGALLKIYKAAPETLEHRVLARLLRSMAEQPDVGVAPRTDIAALGPTVLLLLAAFADDLMSGWYRRTAVRALLLEHKISTASGTNGGPG